MTVTLDRLITCYREGLSNDYECAEYLGVTLQAFKEAIELYKEQFGDRYDYKDYRFRFGSGDKLDIIRWK